MNDADCVSGIKENLMKESEFRRRGFCLAKSEIVHETLRAVQKPKRNGKKLPVS